MTYRDVLDSVITDEPPTRLDLDDLVARYRRGARRRRMLTVTAGAAGLVAAAAAPTWLIFGTPLRGAPTAGTVCTAAPASGLPSAVPVTTWPAGSPDDVPTLAGAEPTEPPAVAAERLSLAICDALVAAAPAAEVAAPFPVILFANAPAADERSVSGPQYVFWTSQGVVVDGRTGAVTVIVGRQDGDPCATRTCEPGPDGTLIVTSDRNDDAMAPHRQVASANVYRPDGSMVSVMVDNAVQRYVWGEANRTGYTGEPAPLTVEQATAIALDPRVTIYP